MSQKWNDFKIVLELLKNSSHLREISRNTKISPSTLQRNLNQLLEENVIDYVQEGKNLKYYLKDSNEADNYIFMAEHFNFNDFIKKNVDLRELIVQIKEIAKENLIVIFGSYAKKTQVSNSDIDLYIETNNRALKSQIELLNNKLSVKIGKFDKNSILGKEIIKNHIILQNIERFYYLIKNEEN